MTNQFARPTMIDNSNAFANPAAMYDVAGNPLTFDSDAAILMRGEGLVGQTFPRVLAPSVLLLITQNVYFTLMPLRKGQVVTNLITSISTQGASVTLGKLGLYKKDGTRVGVTASQTTAWESTGLKVVPLITPYTVPETDVYYAAILAVSAVTMPTVYRGSSGSTLIVAPVGSGAQPWGNQSGQADMPSPATIAVTATAPIWIGAS